MSESNTAQVPPKPSLSPDEARMRQELTALLVEYEEAKARRAAEAERERWRGGPCVFCGVEVSALQRLSGRVEPRWYPSAHGPCCAHCYGDRRAGTLADEEHRLFVLKSLLPVGRRHGWVEGFLLERSGFTWWYETPGAAPGGGERWAFVDLDAVEDRLRPVPAPPLLFTVGEACPRCGVTNRWGTIPAKSRPELPHRTRTRVRPDAKDLVIEHRGPEQPMAVVEKDVEVPPKFAAVWEPARPGCVACHEFDSLDHVVEAVVGVRAQQQVGKDFGNRRNPMWQSWSESIAAQIGVCWYSEAPEEARERPGVGEVAFAHVDVDAAREAAFREWPFASQWANPRVYQHVVGEMRRRNGLR